MTGTAPAGAYIDAAGIRTFCLDRGRGPALVLLHGSSVAIDSWVTWFRTIDALAEAFRVIAFDQVGFGRTDMPREGRYLDRLERTPHALAVLDALGLDKAILVGHSEGGFIAARIAVEQPDRVARLVVITSGGTAPRLGGQRDHAWIAASRAAYDYANGMATEAAFLETMKHAAFTRDREFIGILKANYAQARASGNYDLFRNIPRRKKTPADYVRLQQTHLHPHLPSLRAPMLLVWANDDATVPVERGRRLMEMIPDCEMHVIAKARHMVMVDQAAKFNRLLRAWCGFGAA